MTKDARQLLQTLAFGGCLCFAALLSIAAVSEVLDARNDASPPVPAPQPPPTAQQVVAATTDLREANAKMGEALRARDFPGARGLSRSASHSARILDKAGPSPEAAALIAEADVHDRHLKALEQMEVVRAKLDESPLDAATALGAATDLLTSLPPEYEATASVAELEALRKQAAPKIAAAKKQQARAEALKAECGDAPVPDPWDGGIVYLDIVLRKTAHDPDSIDSSDCTPPVLTDRCWRSECTVRGKNAFGALVADRSDYTFKYVSAGSYYVTPEE